MDSAPAQEVTELLKQWEEQHSTPNYDPIPTLTRIAEIIEGETENFMKKDPDPFDERHPSRTDPECALGHALKVMFKKDNFMTKLVNDYVRDTYYSRQNITGRDVFKLNVAACRLTLDLMPGLEMSVVFQDNEHLIHRLVNWATNSPEPLQCYATGLLAAAMEVQEIATNFRELNAILVPLMLKRLHDLRNKTQDEKSGPLPERQALIERIVSLQRAAARRAERCEFLEEHSRHLTEELRGKNKLLRHLLPALPAGALASHQSDTHKKEIARLGGGAMAALWGGESGGMTPELALEVAARLQAVLEDTLLKNITLKENIDTLGEEIAMLRKQVNSSNDSK